MDPVQAKNMTPENIVWLLLVGTKSDRVCSSILLHVRCILESSILERPTLKFSGVSVRPKRSRFV